MTCRVFVVRHGNTFASGEAPRRIGARTDLPLIESGRAQAVALRVHFADRGIAFDRCLTSPLLRTRQTAALILDGTSCPVAAADWLAEIDHGPDEDQTEDAVRARIGDAALKAWDRDATAPPGWRVDADARREAWRRCLDAATGTTLIVTSNGAGRFALPGAGRLRTGAYGEIRMERRAAQLIGWDVRP